MFFANEIICLDHLKEKIEKQEDSKFTESELVLMGKMQRFFPKKSWS